MTFLSRDDLADLADLRRRLHRRPELSGQEGETARAIAERLRATAPDGLLEGLGGHGVAAIYRGDAPGPTLMFRAELDGLPIEERSPAPHRSQIRGRGHLCGHDGHMATLSALAIGLARQRPRRGRAVLLFQPAEETGAGAAAVLADPRFAEIAPDFAFAWHNMPGLPLGRAALKSGPANCASRGLRAILSGRTAHASAPETGVSPMAALARLMPALTALGGGGALGPGYRLVTVTHARLGEPAFGVAPGEAELFATLRTLTDDGMAALVAEAETLLRAAAARDGLDLAVTYHDDFAHCENAPEATAKLAAALDAEGVATGESGLPMRASEDFGRFRAACPSAMFLLGAGEDAPALHNPDYDFPDALTPIAARVMMRVLRDALG
ncbi:MAG: amidohydrolase [Pseudomonadota bacterium]|nr:amidohydrolase [Pseudomonadota bacterium]